MLIIKIVANLSLALLATIAAASIVGAAEPDSSNLTIPDTSKQIQAAGVKLVWFRYN